MYSHSSRFSGLIAACLTLLLLMTGVASAGSKTWRGTTDSNWDLTTTNWIVTGDALSTPVSFANGDDAVFDDSGILNLTITVAAAVVPNSITVNTTLAAYTINNATGLPIGGAGALTKTGTATLTLGGAIANTFSGGVNANGGTLLFTNVGALGTGTLTFGGGTAGYNNTTAGIVTNNIVFGATGGTLGGVGADHTYGGTVTINASSGTPAIISLADLVTTATDRTVNFSGVLGGAGALRITANATNTTNDKRLALLNNTTTSPYSGAVTIAAAGVLSVRGAAAITSLGTATVSATASASAGGKIEYKSDVALSFGTSMTITGTGSFRVDVNRITSGTGLVLSLGTLTMAANTTLNSTGANTYSTTFAGAVSIGGNVTFNTGGANLNLAGAITETATSSVTITGTGTVAFPTAASINTFSGGLNINSGTLAFNTNTQLGGTGGTTGAVSINGGILNDTHTTGTITNTHVFTIGASGGTINNTGTGTNGKILLNVVNALTGSGTLTKTGPGMLQMAVANNFSGQFNINAGFIEMQNPGALGTGTIVVNAGGELVNSSQTSSPALTMNTGGIISSNGANPTTFTGQITANGTFIMKPRFFQTQTTSSTFTISGKITGAGGFTLDATGATAPLSSTAILSNGANDYTGTTTILAGTLKLGAGDNRLPTAGTFVLNGINGAFDLAGFNQTVSSFTGGGGNVTNSGAPATTSTLTTSATGSYYGTLKDGTGKVALTKNGATTLQLSGNNNFSGGLNVNAGTVVIADPNAMGLGNATLAGTTVSLRSPSVNGFSTDLWRLNGTPTLPTISNNILTITSNAGNEGKSAFLSTPVSIPGNFTASFVYTCSGNKAADGFTFCLQNAAAGATALGATGGSKGYAATITPSLAVVLNIYTGAVPPAPVGTSLGRNGVIASPPIAVSPVAASGGNPIRFDFTYDATNQTLTQVLTDTTANTTQTQVYTAVNLASQLGSTTAYIGFTGGTGGATATQTISNFTFTPATAASTTYSGNVVVSAGTSSTVEVANSSAPGKAVINGGLTLNANSTLNVTSALLNANSVFSLALGATTLSGGNSTVNVANNGTGIGTLILGPMGETGGSFGVAKTGAGTLQTSGTSTNTGATAANAGILNGTGVQSSAITTGGGTVAPGVYGTAPAVGTLTAKSANFSNGTLLVRVNDAGAGHDMLQLTDTGAGALTMGGSSVIVVDLTGLTADPGSTTVVVAQGPTWGATGFATKTIIPSTLFPGVTAFVKYVDNTQSGANVGQLNSKQVIVAFDGNVSPVTLESFTASSEAAGVLLSWNAVSEFKNAGFDVYRRPLAVPSPTETISTWTRVNPALIPGRITNPDFKTYCLYDWPAPGMYEYKLESLSLTGIRETCPTLAGPATLDEPASPLTADSIAALDDTLALAASVLKARKIAEQFSTLDTSPSSASTVHAWVSGSSSLRLAAARAADQKDGSIGRLNAQQHGAGSPSVAPNTSQSRGAAAMRWFSTSSAKPSAAYTAAKIQYSTPGVMLIPQSSLPSGFDIRHVAIQREGRNVSALARTPTGLLVYAPGYQDDYTSKDALFLRRVAGATSTTQSANATGLFTSTLPVNAASPATGTLEFHDVYFDYNFRPYDFSPWFSSQYLTSGTTQSFTLNTPAASSGPATLTIDLWSVTSSDSVNPDHALQVVVNGQPIGVTQQWDGGNIAMQLSLTIPAGILRSGTNQIDLATPSINGVDSQIAFLHALGIDYTRTLDGAAVFEISNTAGTPQLFELFNVPSGNAWVVDTRFSGRESLVATQTQADANGTYRLRFTANAGGKYLFVPAGQENAPLSVSLRQVTPLRLTGAYLATGPSQFSSSVQPLLLARSKEGIRSQFVDQEQVFDYYNFGRFGPAGIQKAVRATKPQYLLLLGRTTYDYKNYSGANVDPLCPTFLVSTSFWAQSTSDSKFGDLGRGYPEVAIGRLPANDTGELTAMVSRILAYRGMPVSGVRGHLVADATDPEVGDFGGQLAALAQSHPDIAWQTNTLGVTYQSSPEVSAAMTAAADGGADLIIYNGHGNSMRLGKNTPRILDTELVENWKGNVVFLQSTCTANWMANNVTGWKSIAMQAMTQTQGGICASIGTSTYMNPDASMAFMDHLLKNASGSGTRWGRALMLSQQWALRQSSVISASGTFYTDLGNTEQIFGDPAMPIFSKSMQRDPNANLTPGTF